MKKRTDSGKIDRMKSGLVIAVFVVISVVALTAVPIVQASNSVIYVPENYTLIQDAVDAASSGDTIIVSEGTYEENIFVDKSITIKSENGPDSTVVRAEYPDLPVFEVAADYVNLSGFTVTEAYEEAGISLFNSDLCNISNNICKNNKYGIMVFLSGNNRISNNSCSKQSSYGIYVTRSMDNSIYNSSCSRNTQEGIKVAYSNNIEIRNTTAYDNGHAGLYVKDSSKNVICNCIFNKNEMGVLLNNANANKLTNNTMFENEYGIVLNNSSENSIVGTVAARNGDTGIRLQKCSNNNKIRNNTACRNVGGLNMEDSSRNIVRDNILKKNFVGIGLIRAHKNELRNNTVSENSDVGLIIQDSTENIVTHNSLSKNLDGIVLLRSNSNELSNNTVCDNSDKGLSIQTSMKNIVCKNILKNNSMGIGLFESNLNEIINNTAYENRDGLLISKSSANVIYNNKFKENGGGIFLHEYSNNNKIMNNTACENEGGVYLSSSLGNIIYNNIFNKNLDGIVISGSNKNEFRNNTACQNSDKGLTIQESSGNVVDNNIFNKNLDGILVIRSDGNEIINNTACENRNEGLHIEESSKNVFSNNIFNKTLEGIVLLSANKNELRNNNLVDSKDEPAHLENSTLNTFDCNYWSDYTGKDKDRDGIGDDPYALEGYGQKSEFDFHPYMNYSGWLNVVVRPEYWEFSTKKGDVNYFYNNFSIQNSLNSPTEVEILLEQNLEFVTDSDSEITSTKTVSIAPKSMENITLRMNVTDLEGYILRTITFKTEDYTKTTLVYGLVQPKINAVKIEGVDYHRNVVIGQINPFNLMLRNHGDRDVFNVTLTMGSKKQSKRVFLSDNKSVTKTVLFEIDTSDMPLGITRGQVVVLKSNQLSDPPLDHLNLAMFVASEHEASTLIVTNLSRFYGSESEELRKELISLTHHPAVNGILLDVACNYSEFKANYTKANELCEAIKKRIGAVINEYPNIKYLIIVGDDNVIPFYRVWDGTKEVFTRETRETGLYDEREYYKSVHYPNPLSESIDGALSSNQFLSDDFYSLLESDKVLAVGRLVEKPDEIIRAIDMFFNYYPLTPKSIFVTSCETPGYEFMYDGSEECYQEWCKRIEIATDKSKRINTTFKYRYKKSSNYGQPHEIIDKICNSSVSAIFLHANYDQFIVPPGKGGGERGYLKAGELKTLNGSLIYSIGCHAGLTIPNVTDLPQSFLSHGTIAYIAPTGYGLGGVITVAGHEQLLDYLTKRIAHGEDVGFALLNAKNDYYLDNFHMDTVDDKVLRSLTLYGFPMYTVRLDSTPPAKSESACATPLLGQAAQKRSIAALSGDTFGVHAKEDNAYNASNVTLEKVTIILEPSYNVVKTENGTYYTYEGYTTEAGMPILPKATLYFIRGEKEIRGMVLRSAKFDVKDTTLVVETFAVSGSVGRSYNFTGWYPTIPFTLNSIEDRQSIVTASAQYKLIKQVSINAWDGTIRLFNETVLEIFRVPEGADREKPMVDVAIDTGTVTVKAEDNAGIYDVLVTYLGPGNRTWASKTMNKQDRWKLSVEYRIPLNNTVFFVQVVDVDGNVKIDDNNGEYYVC